MATTSSSEAEAEAEGGDTSATLPRRATSRVISLAPEQAVEGTTARTNSPGDAPPVPLAQLDANFHHDEKVRTEVASPPYGAGGASGGSLEQNSEQYNPLPPSQPVTWATTSSSEGGDTSANLRNSTTPRAASVAPARAVEVTGEARRVTSGDAPPVPLAQLDANFHYEEKLRNELATTDPASSNSNQGNHIDLGLPAHEEGRPTPDGTGGASSGAVAQSREPPDPLPSTESVSGQDSSRVGIRNFFRSTNDSEVLVQATLVDAEAERNETYAFARKWKLLASVMCTVFTILVVWLSLSLSKAKDTKGEEDAISMEEYQPSLRTTPSTAPSTSPTFDPRPTLKIVQERGYVKCGLRSVVIDAGKGFHLDLCRSIAAVIVGNPDSYEGVPITFANRWQHLYSRAADLLLTPDTHTVEREVRESSTGSGFTFSSVYNYDGMVYFGNRTFVHCAEEQKRYDECSDLMICVAGASTHYDFLKTAFPSDYFKVESTFEDIVDLLFNNTCNVAAWENSLIYEDMSLTDGINDRGFVIGTSTKTKEPLAVVTRNNDREFSDIVNWVIQALFFGEEHGLKKDMSRCRNYAELTMYDASDLDLMNAVFCVGNYGEIFDGGPNRGRNQINQGTGMLYAIPFGDIGKADTIVQTSSTMAKIRNEGSLNCGVVDSEIFEGNVSLSYKLLGMGINYCRTVAAALLNGDPKDVKFKPYSGSEITSFIALANGEIDLLIGGKIQRKYDFARSQSLGGFHYSTPYYYGSEAAGNDVSFYSIAMREDDVQFASFVNCIVLATIYAQEHGIQKEKSGDMPLITLFGSDLNWALRDAIFYSGSYGEIHSSNFGQKNVSLADRGRNTLNRGGPLMLSFPRLP